MAAKAARLDLSEFEALAKRPGTGCGVARAFAALEAQDRAKLEAALADDRFAHTVISRWLALRELKVADHIIGRHRKQQCSCDG